MKDREKLAWALVGMLGIFFVLQTVHVALLKEDNRRLILSTDYAQQALQEYSKEIGRLHLSIDPCARIGGAVSQPAILPGCEE